MPKGKHVANRLDDATAVVLLVDKEKCHSPPAFSGRAFEPLSLWKGGRGVESREGHRSKKVGGTINQAAPYDRVIGAGWLSRPYLYLRIKLRPDAVDTEN